MLEITNLKMRKPGKCGKMLDLILEGSAVEVRDCVKHKLKVSIKHLLPPPVQLGDKKGGARRQSIEMTKLFFGLTSAGNDNGIGIWMTLAGAAAYAAWGLDLEAPEPQET